MEIQQDIELDNKFGILMIKEFDMCEKIISESEKYQKICHEGQKSCFPVSDHIPSQDFTEN